MTKSVKVGLLVFGAYMLVTQPQQSAVTLRNGLETVAEVGGSAGDALSTFLETLTAR